MSTERPRKRARVSDDETRSDLVYKKIPRYQDEIADYYSDYIRPRHVYSEGQSIILEINAGSFSLPFDECRMNCSYKIEKEVDGEWVAVEHVTSTNAAGEDATLAPIQNILESLFLQFDISINGKIISETTNMYPYVGQIVKLLNYSTDAKKHISHIFGMAYRYRNPGRNYQCERGVGSASG